MTQKIVKHITDLGLKIAVAESVTGGGVAAKIISVPGASKIINEAFVAYSDQAKIDRLDVNPRILRKFGAVSPQVAAMMAIGVADATGVDIGISTTGIASPIINSKKPVGLVYISIYFQGATLTRKLLLKGNRKQIIAQTITHVQKLLQERLNCDRIR